jgi:uncharacterized membrane protein YjgN (DUF898 family)
MNAYSQSARWYHGLALLVLILGIADFSYFLSQSGNSPDAMDFALTGLAMWCATSGTIAAIPFIKRRRAVSSHAAQEAAQIPPQEAAAPKSSTSATGRLVFHGNGSSLFGVQIVNAFLTLVTLGVYFFWGKVKVRNYLLSQTEFEGDRFAYHGSGKELLLGTMKAFVIFGLPYGILSFVPEMMQAGPLVESLGQLLALLVLAVFIPVAMVGVRSYRLSRTSWRGIRFSFRGRARELSEIMAKGLVLTAITLGLYYPFFDAKRQAFWVSNSYIGNRNFSFDGQGKDLFGAYLLALLLLPFTLGLSWIWFIAKKQRYFWDHTSIDGARFHSTMTGGNFLALTLTNLLLVLFTLGIALPWAIVRSIRFIADTLSLEGALDLESIRQQAQVASPTGEGLSSFLDIGLDVG